MEDKIEKLSELAELLKKGVITTYEFEELKKELLKQNSSAQNHLIEEHPEKVSTKPIEQFGSEHSNGRGLKIALVYIAAIAIIGGLIFWAFSKKMYNKESAISDNIIKNSDPFNSSVNVIETKFQPIPFLLKNSEWIFVDSITLKPITGVNYEALGLYHEGLAVAKKDGKYGYLDINGNIVIPFIYDIAFDFEDGIANVHVKYYDGYIDKTGREVIPIKFNGFRTAYGDGELVLAFIGPRKNIEWWLVNMKNYQVLSLTSYDNSRDPSDGLVGVSKNGVWGFINIEGQVVVPFLYDEVTSFSEGLAAVKKDGKWVFIDRTGTEVISEASQHYDGFSNGLAPIERDGKWGFMDKTGAVIVGFKYDGVREYMEGIAAVEINGKWGLVDSFGKEITTLIYDDALYTTNGLTSVERDRKWGFVDKTGREVVPLIYDYVNNYSENLAAVKVASKWGFIDNFGKVVVPIIYNEVRDYQNGFAKVNLQGTTYDANSFYINRIGTQYVEK
jgi:hypothetical protein